MKLQEFEHILHPKMGYLKVFLVQIQNTTPHHWHSDVEINLVLDGTFQLTTIKSIHQIDSGDIIILNPYESHRIQLIEGTGLLLVLQYIPKFCNSYFPLMESIMFDQTVLPSSCQSAKIRELLTELAYTFFQEDLLYELSCVGYLNLMLSKLLAVTPYHILPPSEQLSRQSHIRRLKHIMEFINKNYTKKLLLSDIAEYEDLSMHYLSHFFTKHLGISFQEYLRQIRFEKALDLITHTSLGLLDLCIACGFSDSRYLNQLFSKYMGCTPSQYRKSLEDKNKCNFHYFSGSINPDERDLSDSIRILQSYYPIKNP